MTILSQIIFLHWFGRMIQRLDHLIADGLSAGIRFASGSRPLGLLPADGPHGRIAVLVSEHGRTFGVPEGFRRADAFVVAGRSAVIFAGRSDGRRRRTRRRCFGAAGVGVLKHSGFRIPGG